VIDVLAVFPQKVQRFRVVEVNRLRHVNDPHHALQTVEVAGCIILRKTLLELEGKVGFRIQKSCRCRLSRMFVFW
jgi:hypothetical protein